MVLWTKALSVMNLSAWTTAAKSGDVERMRFLLAQNSGSMLHACGKSVCASCTTRSPDNGAHWRSCQRRECANYGSSWDGATALHTASAAGHLEVLQLLVDGGADVNATNSHGKTPLDLAKAPAVAELLRQSGGKESAALEIAPRPSSSEHHSASAQLNSATLSGAVDVVAVRQPDGSLRSTALHVRFGRLLAPFPSGLPVQLTVNEAHVEGLEDALRLGADGAASHVPTPTELGRMGLMPGVNHLGFSCGGRPVVARLHVLAATDRVVISDVDGTITRSDLRGHVPRPLARLMLGDAQVRGVP